jgi:hypothetical protein
MEWISALLRGVAARHGDEHDDVVAAFVELRRLRDGLDEGEKFGRTEDARKRLLHPRLKTTPPSIATASLRKRSLEIVKDFEKLLPQFIELAIQKELIDLELKVWGEHEEALRHEREVEVQHLMYKEARPLIDRLLRHFGVKAKHLKLVDWRTTFEIAVLIRKRYGDEDPRLNGPLRYADWGLDPHKLPAD